MERFNERVVARSGTEVHLIAGTGGRQELDPILECEEHDSRVCVESALGGIEGATIHTVDERHASLGRGDRSLEVLFAEIGLGSAGDVERVRGLDEAPNVAPKNGGAAANPDGGAHAISEYPAGNIYEGVLPSGDSTTLPLQTDTSGGVIIILNTDESGSVFFSLRTPSGQTVDPSNAALVGAEYLSYADGEGSLVQAYRFTSADAGTWQVLLENTSDTTSVAYRLELFGESDLVLEPALEPPVVDPFEEASVQARLARLGEPILAARVEAQIFRPDGSLEIVPLLDDGSGADTVASDGTYRGLIPASGQSGVHVIEVVANDGPETTFWRTATLELLVRSDAASLGSEWNSGLVEIDGDGVPDRLFVEGTVTSIRTGTFFITAEIASTDGDVLSSAGDLLEAEGAGVHPIEIAFDGREIFAARADGPFVVTHVELIDVTSGFVPADEAFDVHTTQAYSWREFGAASDVLFVRGDANADSRVDLSDAIRVLLRLFAGGGGSPVSMLPTRTRMASST